MEGPRKMEGAYFAVSRGNHLRSRGLQELHSEKTVIELVERDENQEEDWALEAILINHQRLLALVAMSEGHPQPVCLMYGVRVIAEKGAVMDAFAKALETYVTPLVICINTHDAARVLDVLNTIDARVEWALDKDMEAE